MSILSRRTLFKALLGFGMLKKERVGTCNPTSFIHPVKEILCINADGKIIQNGKVINSDSNAVRDAFIQAAPIIMKDK